MPPRSRKPRIPLEADSGWRPDHPDGMSREERKARDDAAVAAGLRRNYSWPPFEPGNAAKSTHGAGDLKTNRLGQIDSTGKNHGMSLRAQERAAVFLEQVLKDPAFPEYLKAPMFRVEVQSWANVQTQADMVYEWFQGLPEDEKYVTTKAGMQKTPLELWLGVDAQAAKYRNRLGLNPVSYAKLRVALGLHKKQQDDAIAGLARQGQKIRKRRQAKVIQMRTEGAEGA